eukprot:530381-Pyramimonas_sp.AAC.1
MVAERKRVAALRSRTGSPLGSGAAVETPGATTPLEPLRRPICSTMICARLGPHSHSGQSLAMSSRM